MKKLLILALVLSLLTGCSAGEGRPPRQDINLTYEGEWGPLTEETATLKLFFTKGADSWSSETPIAQWIEEELNLEIITTSSRINTDDAKDLNLHAVDKFPSDIVGGTYILDSIASYVPQGAFYRLDDYFEYMPNFSAFLETEAGEELRKVITMEDGHIYYIPAITEPNAVQSWYLRKDWLEDPRVQESLSFEGLPQTTPQLKEVLVAYRDIILGGNDPVKNPTAPLIVDAYYLLKMPPLFGARSYDRNGEHIVLGVDGKLYDAFMHEDMNHAIQELNQWYNEGLFNWDILEGESDKVRDYYWSNNTGGAMFEAGTGGGDWGIRPDAPEGFELVAILPPKNEKYQTRIYEMGKTFMSNDGWAISWYSSNPELAAAFLDVWWTETGGLVQEYGIEGEHWYIDSANPKVPAKTEKLEQGIIEYGGKHFFLKPLGAKLGWPTMNPALVGYKDPDDVNSYGKQTQEWYKEAMEDGTLEWHPVPNMNFTPEELREIANIKAQLIDWQYFYFFTAIVDDQNPEMPTWDEYIETCKDKGSDRLLEIYQDAYDRYLSN